MSSRSYKVVFITAIVLLAALALWWSVFVRRAVDFERAAAIREIDLRVELDTLEPALASAERIQVERRHSRRTAMALGEGALLFVLVGVCVFMLARMISLERRQLESMRLFLSTVTHEMKTPITGMKTLMQTLAAGKVPPERELELLGMGLDQAERLEHMVENTLIAGRMRLDAQPVRMVPSTVGEVLGVFESHRRLLFADPACIRLEMNVEIATIQVLCDPDAVRVILDNLVDNAIKYGHAGSGPAPGTFRDGEPIVTVLARSYGQGACIDVVDRGRGFEPDQADRIFEPFFRLMDDGSRSEHGTGLGLGIARALARSMGGDVSAASEGPGKGSTFTLTLAGRPA